MKDIRERTLRLAAEALYAAMAADSPRATEAVKAINAECGGEGLGLAISAWCDTLICEYRKATGTAEDAPVKFAWQDADTGDISVTGSDLPDQARWAGRLIAARARLDRESYEALISSLPDDGWVIGGYVSALLSSVALTLQRLAGVTS